MVTSGTLLSGNSDRSAAVTSPSAVGGGISGISGLSNSITGAAPGAFGGGSGGGWAAMRGQGQGAAAAGGGGGGGTRWFAVQDKACGTVTHMAPEAMVKGGWGKGHGLEGHVHRCWGLLGGGLTARLASSSRGVPLLGRAPCCTSHVTALHTNVVRKDKAAASRSQAPASTPRWTSSPSVWSCEWCACTQQQQVSSSFIISRVGSIP